MKERVKSTLKVILIIVISSSISVGAITLINSKDVLYDNTTSGLKATTVQGAVDELYTAATDYSSLATRVTTLENDLLEFKTGLNNLEYTAITPVSGVSITGGGYTKIGNLVIVRMQLSINKSTVTLSKTTTNPTKIATGLPKPERQVSLASYYASANSEGYYDPHFTQGRIDVDGNLYTSESSLHPYTTNWGFVVFGSYITSE